MRSLTKMASNGEVIHLSGFWGFIRFIVFLVYCNVCDMNFSFKSKYLRHLQSSLHKHLSSIAGSSHDVGHNDSSMCIDAVSSSKTSIEDFDQVIKINIY